MFPIPTYGRLQYHSFFTLEKDQKTSPGDTLDLFVHSHFVTKNNKMPVFVLIALNDTTNQILFDLTELLSSLSHAMLFSTNRSTAKLLDMLVHGTGCGT